MNNIQIHNNTNINIFHVPFNVIVKYSVWHHFVNRSYRQWWAIFCIWRSNQDIKCLWATS